MMKSILLAALAAFLLLAGPAAAEAPGDLTVGLQKAVYARGMFNVLRNKYLTMTDGDCLAQGPRHCDEPLDLAVRLTQGYERTLLETAHRDLGTATLTVLPGTARLPDVLGALTSNIAEADTIIAAYREALAK